MRRMARLSRGYIAWRSWGVFAPMLYPILSCILHRYAHKVPGLMR